MDITDLMISSPVAVFQSIVRNSPRSLLIISSLIEPGGNERPAVVSMYRSNANEAARAVYLLMTCYGARIGAHFVEEDGALGSKRKVFTKESDPRQLFNDQTKRCNGSERLNSKTPAQRL